MLMAMSNDDSPASGSVNDVDNDGMNHAHTLSSTHTIPQSHHTHAPSHLPLHPHPQEQQQNRGLLSPETDLDLRYSENLRPNLVDRLSGSVPEGRENNTVDGDENDLGMSMDELSNPEYTARRASTTSTMSASGASSSNAMCGPEATVAGAACGAPGTANSGAVGGWAGTSDSMNSAGSKGVWSIRIRIPPPPGLRSVAIPKFDEGGFPIEDLPFDDFNGRPETGRTGW